MDVGMLINLIIITVFVHEPLSPRNRFHRRQKFCSSFCLRDVTPCTQFKCFVYHLGGGLLSQEDNACFIGNLADLASCFKSIDSRQADVE